MILIVWHSMVIIHPVNGRAARINHGVDAGEVAGVDLNLTASTFRWIFPKLLLFRARGCRLGRLMVVEHACAASRFPGDRVLMHI